jgi:Flp pilus assembly pilin Flp
MLHMLEAIRRRTVEQDGQTMAEYSLVLSVITITAVGAFILLGGAAITSIERVAALF